ncbi:MAG: NADH-quinone oxidoreductase subunit NuoH [Bacillota bacterium]|nr:NADH-quinone oxidoreductase subunit NuoH [Bacillota bacterium]
MPAGWPRVILYASLASLVVLGLVSGIVLFLVYLERRVLGRLQARIGPNRVGPWGLLQTTADALKLLTKEDIVPAEADRILFVLAPLVVFFGAAMAFAVVPAGPRLVLVDLGVGVLFVVGMGSLAMLGYLMAGWASHSKYSLLGGMRAVAQLVSYELPLTLALLGVVILSGSLAATRIVEVQRHGWFILLQPLGFFIYFTAGLAEINRSPFDLPEGESELVGGYHTEYSGMRWALFFLAEYAGVFSLSALAATLYLGGWLGPWLPGPVWLLLKTFALVFAIIWLRGTWLRPRLDQLLSFSWKFLLPLSLVNLAFTAAEVYFLRWLGVA